jgi:epoxyqueuosine reductase
MSVTLKETLKAYSLKSGFSTMGVCRPDAAPETTERLAAFVAEGRHGQMEWMADRMEWRGSAAALWPEAKSVIMLAEAYTPDHDPLAVLEQRQNAAISVYAQGRDYHDIVKKRLKKVGGWFLDTARTGGYREDGIKNGKWLSICEPISDAEIKVFVDTAPVMEKPLAAAAGLGWQGKHTNLLSRELGNWFFLGAIFTTVELPSDAQTQDHCGSCRACLDICPTNAFPAPNQLDARRCISYLTIEHKGPVDLDLRALMGNRIYGCDDCLAVCPWNKFASQAQELRYASSPDAPSLSELAMLDDPAFRARFSGSPIKRIGRDRFVRNVLYAIGNSDQVDLVHVARALLDDADPTVVDAAEWAVERLLL